MPPENSKALVEKAYILCHSCKRSLLDKSTRVLKCKTCACYLCKDCKSPHAALEGEHNIKKVKNFVNPEENEEEQRQAKIDKIKDMLDQYDRANFTDVIGKDLFTRFKYKQVKAFDFGLSEEDILLLTDSELNRLVKLRKYKTYRDDEEFTNVHRVRQVKREYKPRLEEEKRHIKEVMKANIKVQKEALLGIKTGARKERDRLIKMEKQRLKNLKKHGKIESLFDQEEEGKFKKQKTTETEESGAKKEAGGVKDRSHLYQD